MSWSYPPTLPARRAAKSWFPTPPLPTDPLPGPYWYPYVTASGLAGALRPLVAQLVGTVGLEGNLAAALRPLAAHLDGEQATVGQLAAAMAALRGAMTNIITSDMAGQLPPLRAALLGSHGVTGQLSGQLPILRGALSGEVVNYGQLAGALPPMRAALLGSTRVDGTLAGRLAKLQASMAGGHATTGNLAGALARLQASMVGVHSRAGQLSGGLRAIQAGMVGSVKNAVVFDNSSDGGRGGTTTRSWTHDNIAGNCIGVMYSNTTSSAQTCTYGGVNIPRVYGPQSSGMVFPYTSYTSVFALVSNSLPTGPNTVACTGAGTASSAAGVTFANAGSLGTVLGITANGNLNQTINPGDGAAAFCAFGGSSNNFGPVTPYEIIRNAFVTFVNWASMMGYGFDTGSGITFASTQAISKGGAIVPILPPT